MTAVRTVAAVTKQVHRDKGDEDQQPEPVRRKPFHEMSPNRKRQRLAAIYLTLSLPFDIRSKCALRRKVPCRGQRKLNGKAQVEPLAYPHLQADEKIHDRR